jgi:hypothetical protein
MRPETDLSVATKVYGRGGPHRDAEGRPLEGVLVTKPGRSNLLVRILVGGFSNTSFRCPDLDYYTHRLLDPSNLRFVAGGGNNELVAVVMDGRKPVASVGEWKKADAARWRRTIPSRFEKKFYRKVPGAWFVDFGPKQPLGSLLDINAVEDTYARAFRVVAPKYRQPALLDLIHNRLTYIAKKTPLTALHEYDWANWGTVDDIMTTGLCLGYPLFSTIARIASHIRA